MDVSQPSPHSLILIIACECILILIERSIFNYHSQSESNKMESVSIKVDWSIVLNPPYMIQPVPRRREYEYHYPLRVWHWSRALTMMNEAGWEARKTLLPCTRRSKTLILTKDLGAYEPGRAHCVRMPNDVGASIYDPHEPHQLPSWGMSVCILSTRHICQMGFKQNVNKSSI